MLAKGLRVLASGLLPVREVNSHTQQAEYLNGTGGRPETDLKRVNALLTVRPLASW